MEQPRLKDRTGSNQAESNAASPSSDETRAQLERILACHELQMSDHRAAFLRFIVEETLAGRAHHIKGYTVAVTVFERDETFDAQNDPVVRLEARKLRRELDTYYANKGRHDPVRISVPKGGYVPLIEWSDDALLEMEGDQEAISTRRRSTGSTGSAVTPETPGKNRWTTGVLSKVAWFTSFVVLIAAVWLLVGNRSPGLSTVDARGEPAVIVLPFEVLGVDEYSNYLSMGLSQDLILKLMRFPGFRVFTDFNGPKMNTGPVNTDGQLDAEAAYVISGTIQKSSDHMHITAQLRWAKSGEVVWAASYEHPFTPQALVQMQDELAGAIATEVGQPYGVVGGDMTMRLATPAVSSMQSYVCVLRAFSYRRTFLKENFTPVLACLESAVVRDPEYSDAWAMLGWLHLDAGRFDFVGPGHLQEEYQTAYEAASHALLLEPENPLALKALASIQHYRGYYDESVALVRKALELNPYNPDTLAQMGWRLVVRENYEEGVAMLHRAISRTVNPPAWYFPGLAVYDLMTDDFDALQNSAKRASADGLPLGLALIAVADAEKGDLEGTRVAMERLSNADKLLYNDPDAYIRRHGATDAIANKFEEYVKRAKMFAESN